MKFCTFALVALATVLLYTERVDGAEICPQENCLIPEMCEEPVRDTQVQCSQQGTTCCSIVKRQYRTYCRHHSGVCMDSCNTILQRDAVDCPNNQVCCILV